MYVGCNIIEPLNSNGFTVRGPRSWGLILETHLDGSDVATGMQTAILDYEWSPVVQFNKLGAGVKWSEDMARLDAELSTRQALQQIQTIEALTTYNKFTGHGMRKVGVSRGRRSEFILFYPEGEMRGTRLLVLLFGAPNELSLRELEGIIHSVSYEPASQP